MLKVNLFLNSFLRKIKFYRHRLHIKNLVKNGLKLGKNVTIATTASLDDEYCYLISIGDNCTISHHVRILAHDATTFKFTGGYTKIAKVEIKNNCYFGENVIILPGVTIGPNVLVAAGSVVNKDILPNSCVAGVPARFYAKFDEFIESHKNKIEGSNVFTFSDLQLCNNNNFKKEIIAAVENSNAYVQGYIGRFPTTFNPDETLFRGIKSWVTDFDKIHPWILSYISNKAKSPFLKTYSGQKHVFLCITDHFEPLGGNASLNKSIEKLQAWCETYPKIASKFMDSDNCLPKYSFFYPIEEYRPEFLSLLSELCHKGYGEVEVHLHHDNDTADNLRDSLLDFKSLLSGKYRLLSVDKVTGEIKYGFIHGNWALDNSRSDGRWCGVNNELSILQETGCYADFTMPSAPDSTQTTKINSIYYAIDDPLKPKSHNFGIDAKQSKNNQKGVLMIQGPLMLNWKNRKNGILPRIENGFIGFNYPIDLDRIKLWLDADVHVQNNPEFIFVKLYTHGCQEKNMHYLLSEGLNNLFFQIKDHCNKENFKLHYVSAREMVNVIKALEDNFVGSVSQMKDYRFKLIRN